VIFAVGLYQDDLMNWGEQVQWREKVHQRYPEIWTLKIVRKRLPFILKHLRNGESVLEIGAFDRSLEGRLKKFYPEILYKSLDIDPSYPHEYSSFEEVKEEFDMVLLFEVIEHLNRGDGREMVAKVFEILKPGGRVILTTPNTYTPGQYWKDASHQTPYHYEELGGLFLSQQFGPVEIYRLFNGSFLRYVMRVYLLSSVFRFLGIDFTKSILLVAQKAPSSFPLPRPVPFMPMAGFRAREGEGGPAYRSLGAGRGEGGVGI